MKREAIRFAGSGSTCGKPSGSGSSRGLAVAPLAAISRRQGRSNPIKTRHRTAFGKGGEFKNATET
jgi:hypothetical protein